MPAKKSDEARRSSCPIACSLDLIGDKWTLLVLRDLFLGKARYKDLLASEEAIPTNILAERLLRLQDFGLIAKIAYQDHPPRFEYHLTELGRELGPVLGALAYWGKRRLAGTKLNRSLQAVLSQERNG